VIVPPVPADATRAVNDVTPVRLYGVNEIQSPFSMYPIALPPLADGLATTVVPCWPL
jgi:hypothetical protein